MMKLGDISYPTSSSVFSDESNLLETPNFVDILSHSHFDEEESQDEPYSIEVARNVNTSQDEIDQGIYQQPSKCASQKSSFLSSFLPNFLSGSTANSRDNGEFSTNKRFADEEETVVILTDYYDVEPIQANRETSSISCFSSIGNLLSSIGCSLGYATHHANPFSSCMQPAGNKGKVELRQPSVKGSSHSLLKKASLEKKT